MRTPGIVIFGLVMAPCGWILDLTSTVAPNWRTLTGIAQQSSDTVLNQGIWDMCKSSTTSSQVTCNLKSTDSLYFNSQIIPIAQGMMVASLVVTVIGLIIVTPGARCWRDRPPRWILVGVGGILIFCSGVLTIIPIAWYTYLLPSLNTTTVFANGSQIQVGYCIVLGYIGGIMEILGGIVLFIGICRCCGGRNRGEKPRSRTTNNVEPRPHRTVRPTPQPRAYPPRQPSPSSSSVSYARDDDLDFPRVPKTSGKGRANPAYNGHPYDADL